VLLLAGLASAQPRMLTIPFHSVNGMIFLDVTVNDKPAVLVLDTGSNHTMVSVQLAGVSATLRPATMGVGVPRECVRTKIAFGTGKQFTVEPVNLSAIGKGLPARIDGILGEDVLQEFSAVRIDFKNHVVELE